MNRTGTRPDGGPCIAGRGRWLSPECFGEVGSEAAGGLGHRQAGVVTNIELRNRHRVGVPLPLPGSPSGEYRRRQAVTVNPGTEPAGRGVFVPDGSGLSPVSCS